MCLPSQPALIAQLTSAARQLETVQSSVQFSAVNAMQSELNRAKDERASLEVRVRALAGTVGGQRDEESIVP